MANKADQNLAAGKKEVGLNKCYRRCRIEELPDEILFIIISYLSVKGAISTRVLSRRWRNLYLFMPRLNFDCDTFISIVRMNFVDKIVDQFLQHYSGAKIESFRLSVPNPFWCYDDTASVRWIRSAIQMGAEELDLTYLDDYFNKFSFEFLSGLLTSKLKHLHLRKCRIELKLEHFLIEPELEHFQWYEGCMDPAVVSEPLHSLATLELEDVPLDVNILECIFSICVNLRKLLLRSCKFPPSWSTLAGHSLATLELENVPLDVNILECIFSTCVNLENLLLRQCKFPPNLSLSSPTTISLKCLQMFSPIKLEKLEFSAPQLTYFEYQSSNPSGTKLSFSNVPKLEEMRLDMQLGDGRVDDMFRDFATDALRLKRLMSLHTTLDFKLEPRIPVSTSILCQLEQLELILGCWRYCNLLKMIPVLVACPLLQKFHLTVSGLPTNVPNMQYPGKHPFPHLKEVKISRYHGTSSENPFVFYLLESAVALERMILGIIPRLCHNCKFKHLSHELPNQRIRAKVASTTAKLVIQHHSNEGVDFAKLFIR